MVYLLYYILKINFRLESRQSKVRARRYTQTDATEHITTHAVTSFEFCLGR